MNSEITSANSLIQSLKELELATSKYSKFDDSQIVSLCAPKSTQDFKNDFNIFERSKNRMLKLSSIVGIGDRFSITNLYESLKLQVIRSSQRSIITDTPPVSNEDNGFYLDKVKICVSNGGPDVARKESIFTNFDLSRPPSSVEKKRRTVISPSTREFLEQAYGIQPNPTKKDRELIAKKCNLTPVQVRVWFTNKRMRTKSAPSTR